MQEIMMMIMKDTKMYQKEKKIIIEIKRMIIQKIVKMKKMVMLVMI
jgi:hypothetical protein